MSEVVGALDGEPMDLGEGAGHKDDVRDEAREGAQEPAIEYQVGGDEVVDLSHGVASARPDDVLVPEPLAKLFSYAVPTLLGMVRRRELLPPLLVVKRADDGDYFLEPIEEELRNVDDLLEYTQRRIANDLADRAARAGRDDCPAAMVAYGCAYDQRVPGFNAVAPHDDVAGSDGVDNPVHDTANMALAVIGGCDASPAGVTVVQRFKPKFFGGAVLLGAPAISQGPDSLLGQTGE